MACADAGGFAVSKTSPATMSASTSCSANWSSRNAKKRACSCSREQPCSVCPRCQSDVWQILRRRVIAKLVGRWTPESAFD